MPVPASAEARAIELDPGEHVVQASAAGRPPFETRVTLAEGQEQPLSIPLAKEEPPAPPPARNNTLAYAALGAGGALLATSAILLIVREGQIDDMETICPGGVCPASSRSTVESKRDDAELFGPLGIGLGVVGLAAAGFGAYMLLRPSPGATAPATGATTWRFGPTPLRGGAMMGVGATF